jgi:hypothetical protein
VYAYLFIKIQRGELKAKEYLQQINRDEEEIEEIETAPEREFTPDAQDPLFHEMFDHKLSSSATTSNEPHVAIAQSQQNRSSTNNDELNYSVSVDHNTPRNDVKKFGIETVEESISRDIGRTFIFYYHKFVCDVLRSFCCLK